MATVGRMIFQTIFIAISLWHSSHANIGYFWQITDIHLDLNHSTNGNRDKICWRHNGHRTSEGRFGDYGCDSPLALVESAVKAMKKVTAADQIEFILWTGDSVSHATHGNEEHFTDQNVYSVLSNVTSLLKREFPFSNIYPVLGNMDWYPKHGMAPGSPGFHDRLAKYGQLWSQWVPPESLHDFNKGGYYAIESKDKKPRLLILNTSLYHKKSSKIPTNDNDPAGQFKWLKSQLMEATERGETVYIIGHIPPGNPERYMSNRLGHPSYQDSFTKKYMELVREFYPVIAGQFFGYFHSDSFRVFYKKMDKDKGRKFLDRDPISYLFVAPAVSPRKSSMADEIGPNNPGIRLYQYNTTSGQIFDYSQYYLNLTEANENNRDDWKILYNLTSYYNLPNVSAASLSDLAYALNTRSQESMFNKYYHANSVGYADVKPCTNLCRRTHFCVITNVDQGDYERCIQTVLSTFGSSSRPQSTYFLIPVTFLLLTVLKSSYSSSSSLLPFPPWRPTVMLSP